MGIALSLPDTPLALYVVVFHYVARICRSRLWARLWNDEPLPPQKRCESLGLIICNRLPKQDYSLRVRVPKQTYSFSDERVFSLSPAICVGNSAARKGCSRTK